MSAIFALRSHDIVHETIDGETVIIDMANGAYFRHEPCRNSKEPTTTTATAYRLRRRHDPQNPIVGGHRITAPVAVVRAEI